MNNCSLPKRLAIARTGDGRYVWAIYSDAGFALYQLSRQSKHFQKKIRKTCRQHGVELPAKMDWDELPFGQFIEKKDGEPEAKIVGGPPIVEQELSAACGGYAP
jgi:hypothetical protein